MGQKSKRVAKLWKQLEKTGMSNEDLVFFMTTEIPSLKRKAAEILLRRNPANSYLVAIVINLSDYYRNRSLIEIACVKLLGSATSNEELKIVLKYSLSQKKRAAEKIFFNSPTNMDLCFIARYYPEMSPQCWIKLKNRILKVNEARYLVEYCENELVRKEAGEWILENSRLYADARFVAEQIPSLRKKAWNLVLGKEKKTAIQLRLFEGTSWYQMAEIKREKIFKEILQLTGAA